MTAVVQRILALCAVAFFLGGCALLPTGSKKRVEHTYLIAPAQATVAQGEAGRCGVVQVGVGSATPGQRGANMAYSVGGYELKYFAFARWGDAPSRMLRDELRTTLRASGAFEGVLTSPVSAQTDYQIELADVSVVQHFDEVDSESSTVRLGFEVRLFDGDRRHLLAATRLNRAEAAGMDPESGVEASNVAAAALLREAGEFVLTRCGSREL